MYFYTAKDFAQSSITFTDEYNMSKIKFKDDSNLLGNLYNKYM